jgi:hypothetical protein
MNRFGNCVLKHPGASVACIALLLVSCDLPNSDRGIPTIIVAGHHCFPSCQSFSLMLQEDGKASISVFRATYNGNNWSSKFKGVIRRQVDPVRYRKLHDLIDDLDIEDMDQPTAKKRLSCADAREPLLKISSSAQFEHERTLFLTCPEHGEAALKIASVALTLVEATGDVEQWPREKIPDSGN